MVVVLLGGLGGGGRELLKDRGERKSWTENTGGGGAGRTAPGNASKTNGGSGIVIVNINSQKF